MSLATRLCRLVWTPLRKCVPLWGGFFDVAGLCIMA